MSISSGTLIVLSGPSCVGKNTLKERIKPDFPELAYSISATTRKPRPGEIDGKNYFFKTRDEFQRMREHGELVECAEFAGNWYGTPRAFLEQTLRAGKSMLLEIEVKGAEQIRKLFPSNSVLIFVEPPSLDALAERMQARKANDPADMEIRLATAEQELKEKGWFHHTLVNDNLEVATTQLRDIVRGILRKGEHAAAG